MNYNSAYTAEELRAADKAGIIDKKVIALGGIDVDNNFRSKRLRLWRSSHLRCFVE